MFAVLGIEPRAFHEQGKCSTYIPSTSRRHLISGDNVAVTTLDGSWGPTGYLIVRDQRQAFTVHPAQCTHTVCPKQTTPATLPWVSSAHSFIPENFWVFSAFPVCPASLSP